MSYDIVVYYGYNIMSLKAVVKKHYFFVLLNILSIVLLNVWIFKSCIKVNSSLTSIIMDFSALLTCVYSLVRVAQSLGGDFKIMDMVTVYYASLFFLFSWFMKACYLAWDYVWGTENDIFNLAISVTVFVTLLVNFYTTERVNIDNLEKIESFDDSDLR